MLYAGIKMTSIEIYTLILCLIVFVLLTSLGIFAIVVIYRLTTKLIKGGLQDEAIVAEFSKDKKQSKLSRAIDFFVLLILCLFIGVIAVSSVYINCTQNTYFENVPTYRVVKTDSMSKQNEKNKYLFTNNLNNQIQTFDLIAMYKLPEEKDLKLYDIVIYEVDGILIVHRIVGIEEPNANHPNERHFKLQGDAVDSPDRFPVLYSQMKGIYRGERIPFVGSFVLFMQSPAGWMCILLVFVSIIATPILDKKLLNARKARYALITSVEVATTEVSTDNAILQNNASNLRFVNFGQRKTFYEKLADSSEQMQNRYNAIKELLLRIEGVRVIEANTQHTYKCKTNGIARLFFKGKTLNVCLGLNPNDYKDSKYIFTDLSQKEKYKNYPMCLKLTSERQTRWAKELILALAKSKGLVILEKPSQFVYLKGKNNKKTFKQKLSLSPLAKERFNNLKSYLNSINGIRVLEGKYNQTYKIKNKPILKFVIKGKTLNVYLGLNPKDYENTKYIFTDVSNITRYANYPMRVKVSSYRQVKWVKELIQEIIKK